MKKTIKNPISKNWDTRRYKFVFSILQGLAFKSEDYVNEPDVVNIRMGNIKKGGKIDLYHNTKYLPSDFPNRYPQYLLHEDDLIISMTDMSPSLEFLAVPAKLEGLEKTKKYLLNQRVGKLIFKKGFDPTYIKYTLLSESLRNQLKSQGLGTVQSNMSNENLYTSLFFVPKNIETQKLIARYLDKKTEQIDRLVGKIQKKIKLLKEQRTALINHCVTKGLNPNVEMKDSGIEWLGEIPKHWRRSKLKYLCEIHGRIGYRGYTVDDIVSEGEGCITLGPGNIIDQRLSLEKLTYLSWEKYEESPEIQVFDEDVIFVKTGSTIGKTCIVKNTHYKMTLNPQMIVMKNIKINPEYFYLQSTCNFFQLSFWVEQTGSSTPTISQEKIYEFPMIVPPVEEQGRIVNRLGSIISKNQNLMDLNIQKINKLKEYRQSLISSVVTGKVRVTEDMI